MASVAALAFVALGLAAFVSWRRHASVLTTLVLGGGGPPTLVLLHGYGSSAERWIPFARTIRLGGAGRFVFPQGPERTVPPEGPVDGRAWWRLDLASHVPAGGRLPDLSAARPVGLPASAALVQDRLARLRSSSKEPPILGGFSQGAMVACQIAFLSDVPLTALVLLSGTLVDESTWMAHMPRRRGLPVFLAHGRRDDVLPYALAERLRARMQAAGLVVTFVPFEGGHDIPAEVVEALNRFLATVPTAP